MSELDEPSDQEVRMWRDIVIKADLASTMQDMEDALGWVVLTHEPEIGLLRIYGLFNEPAAALECAAAAHRVRLEEYEDEEDWSVRVYPLLPP